MEGAGWHRLGLVDSGWGLVGRGLVWLELDRRCLEVDEAGCWWMVPVWLWMGLVVGGRGIVDGGWRWLAVDGACW